MKRAVLSLLSLSMLAAALAFYACSSDESTPIEPEPADPAYIWAGNGQGGFGTIGNLPRKTRLYWPQDVTFTPDGRPIVIDWNNHRVIALDAAGNFELIAGDAENDLGEPCPDPPAPCVNLDPKTAALNHPTQIAFDPATGNTVLCAWHNSALFLIDSGTGLMDRFCGTGARPCFGPSSDPQPLDSVCVDLPSCAVFDPQGNLCFTDQGNHIVRRINMTTRIIETIAGTQPVFNPNSLPPNPKNWVLQFGYTGDGGLATQAKLQFERGQIADPSGKICFDNAGNMYIADFGNHAVRMVDTNGFITRVAGAPPIDDGNGGFKGQSGYSGDGGPALNARLYEPRDVACDLDGTLYIADTGNNVIRRVRPDGTISTVMGVHRQHKPQALQPHVVMSEDGVSARLVRLTEPSGVAVSASGRLWVADTGNNVIRILDP